MGAHALDIFAHRWDQDAWSIGAYSCLTVESTDQDPEILRRSVNDHVFFAGEATNHQYQGTLQAAYITGTCRFVLWRSRNGHQRFCRLLSNPY